MNDTASTEISRRTAVIAGSPTIQALNESLTMNAVTIYTSRESIRATTTGYVHLTKVAQGTMVKRGQLVFRLKTKEAQALGEKLLQDPDINITGIVSIISRNPGIITQVFFQDGDYVVDGDVLAELTKPGSLAAKLFVPYEYSNHVQLQKQVQVRLPDGEMINGIISHMLPSEDVTSQTMPYLITLNPFRFLPENMNLTVTVSTMSHDQALVIPAQAVQSNEEQTNFWIMKILNDTLAVRQNVDLGIRTDSLIELVNSNLTPLDRIIFQGAYGLADTAAVTLVTNL